MPVEIKQWERERYESGAPAFLRPPRMVFVGISPLDSQFSLVEFEDTEAIGDGITLSVSRTPDPLPFQLERLPDHVKLTQSIFPFAIYRYTLQYLLDGVPSVPALREFLSVPSTLADCGTITGPVQYNRDFGQFSLEGTDAYPDDLTFDLGHL